MLDIQNIKQDFPILDQIVHNKPLVYLDNAASSQKPLQVINAIKNYYTTTHSNVHRGVHYLSQQATLQYENARKTVQNFIHAKESSEIIFTKGTTDSINLLASSFGKNNIQKDDEIIVSHMEHHANIVPWKILAETTGAKVKVIPVNDNGELEIEAYKKLITNKTKIVSVVYVSNSLGTINPVKEIIQIAHEKNIPVHIDAAQAVPHMEVNVEELNCDFLSFSSHKMYGPTGIGVLYGKKEHLEKLPPYQGGGDMILSVSFDEILYAPAPQKFEAGTPNIAGAIGLAAAITYLQSLGFENIAQHEQELLDYANTKLKTLPQVKIIGNSHNKVGVISFVIEGIHPHDIGSIVDQEGVAIRTGNHCTEPVMKRFGLNSGTSRASFGIYNTKEDIDALVEAIQKCIDLFA